MGRIPPLCIDDSGPLPPNLSFVLGLSPSVMTLGLGNMRKLMAALGRPEQRFAAVLVAGTNGKGSVAALTAGILRAHGKRVGLYTSPHVFSVRERIAVDGRPCDLGAMEEAAERIVPLFDAIRYSYFEALTAIAFQIFANERVETAVLEVGLGGRFDATNVVEPVVSVLTGVSLDHRRILGDTEEEILREKLGIARPGVPLVCGRLPPGLREIVEMKAGVERIPLHGFDSLGTVEALETTFHGMRLRLRTAARDYGEVRAPVVGARQTDNVLIAVRVSELVLGRVENLVGAVADARLPGRFQALEIGGKILVLDVAHNDAALAETARTLTSLSPPGENGIILAVMRRKELRDFPAEIPKNFRHAWLVDLEDDDAYRPEELLDVIGIGTIRDSGLNVSIEHRSGSDGAWERFLRRIFSFEEPVRVFLATGSHRTVEAVGRRLRAAGLC